MEKPAEIDAFALCASPFAAPAALVLFGLVGAAGSSNMGFFTVLFWQAVLAFEYAGAYLAVSLPLAWLLWRIFPTFCSNRRPNLSPLLITVAVFSVSANARFFGILSVGPFEPEIFSFIVGVALNATAFVWLHRLARTTRSSGPTARSASRQPQSPAEL